MSNVALRRGFQYVAFVTRAEDYFASRELNTELGLDSPDRFWQWALSGGRDPRPRRWFPSKSDALVYRGQHDSSYGLSSSLFRAIQEKSPGIRVLESHLVAGEDRVIKAAREENIGRNMTDGELLMVLQHHRVPTRLIDVSTRLFDALYFSVDSLDERDGRLFLIYTTSPSMSMSNDRDAPVLASGTSSVRQLRRWREPPWRSMQVGRTRAASDWTCRVSPVTESDLDPRMRAQSGRFLVGGQIAAYPGMTLKLGRDSLPVQQWQDITTLPIQFPSGGREVRNRGMCLGLLRVGPCASIKGGNKNCGNVFECAWWSRSNKTVCIRRLMNRYDCYCANSAHDRLVRAVPSLNA
jgi:hypothetical protein